RYRKRLLWAACRRIRRLELSRCRSSLVGGIAFGLWKRSRFAAVAGVVYWMISAAVKLADGQRFGIVTLLILLGFIHGIRETFALAKYRKAVDTVGHHSR